MKKPSDMLVLLTFWRDCQRFDQRNLPSLLVAHHMAILSMSYKTNECKSLLSPLEVHLSYEEPEASRVAARAVRKRRGRDYEKSLAFASWLQGGHVPELIQEKVVSFVERYNQQYTKETAATSKPKDAMLRHELEYLRSGNELELLSLLPNARDEEEPSERARGTRASGKAGQKAG
ncbi:hypothetical protein SELMODRAFT_431279 [Selaginella moellendorffii]|uniref:Uncharacterized protein n=1 Tax=Selaginella moellendorffii TaxID=88036 RepID=D8TC39_SELML|nr:hypothetical protein SELMODRAFT_431279 [Selaginella moellendorffii]